MNKFKGILLCTDLDGTLLKKDKTVSNENLEAIEYFKTEGGLFTFVTGRAPMFMRTVLEMITPNAPIGCLNGGAIYDLEKGKYIWQKPISTDVLELVRYIDERVSDVGIQVVTYDRIYFCRENYAMERFRQLTGTPRFNAEFDEVPQPFGKILFGDGDPDKITRIKELLDSHPRAAEFDYIRSEKSLYEILPKGVSKGSVLIKMAEILGIDMKNTVAVGDYNNDIEMVKAAGLGIAVDNAVAELKAVADRVTVSNEESAIAKIIYEL